jgi:hypothetical protein
MTLAMSICTGEEAERLILCIDRHRLESSSGSGEFPLFLISLTFSIAVSQPPGTFSALEKWLIALTCYLFLGPLAR